MADPRLVALADAKAKQYGVPPALARAVIAQESGWDPHAKSPAGAGGLMQLMPGTARGLGVKNVNDPVQNLDGGMRYLSHLLQQFKSPELALAAYNAGPAAVTKYGGIPPYAETQNYVKTIMGNMGQDPGGGQGAPDPNAPALPPPPGGNDPLHPQSFQAMLDQAAPSAASRGILDKLGGMAGDAAQAAQAPIQAAPQPGQASPDGQQPDPYNPVPLIPHGTGLDGNIPMTFGGPNPYTHIHFSGHVDFQHVNPRLLDALNREAKKRGVIVNVISGYRSNNYSDKTGGFAGDPHSKGIAVDAYIGGHPIGDVIPPQDWAKYGIRSGNTPGFYKGKPDPEHLDLVGIPIKGGKKK